ncbi:MAG: hypothetical protein IJ062_12660 [Firmicutes bacterium]|nr:hypothetical protein [Bacillota bacterium]
MEFQFYDIINKSCPVHINDSLAAKYPRMPRQDRAKIFAPFAALHGHAEQTHAQERITVERIELSQDSIDEINIIIQDMEEKIDLKQTVKAAVTYFVPDTERTNEGYYATVKGKIDKIDVTFGKMLIDGQIINFDDIYNIAVK